MNVGSQVRKFMRFNFASLIKRTLVSQGGVSHRSINSPFLAHETGFYKNELIKPKISLPYDADLCLLTGNIPNLSIKDGVVRSSISEPRLQVEINVRLPFSELVKKDFKLPSLEKGELIDPTSNVIEKKARKSVMRIRKKKMKLHKWKKLQKKMKYVFAKIRNRRRAKREKEFLKLLSHIHNSGKDYNPEQELEDNIEILKWERPVTRIKGFLAPKSVVEEYLKQKEMKAKIDKKVEECLKKL